MATAYGDFIIRLADPTAMMTLHYQGKGIIVFVWVAPWAQHCLRSASYYELDCSFQALHPYAYSVPMAIHFNVGIPLGIVVAPTERKEVFELFAHQLFGQGFTREELAALPLASDIGQALAAYAKLYHRWHYFCYRHVLESLGSRTLAAMLALRLMFTRTLADFLAKSGQTLSDFAEGCRARLITENGYRIFCQFFGVTGVTVDGDGIPALDSEVFAQQALWGERGMRFGVGSCTNHIEGFHAHLNEETNGLRNPVRKLVTIMEAIRANAATWADKVLRGRCTALNHLKKITQIHPPAVESCPRDGRCDRGDILSRRLGMRVSCAHVPVDAELQAERPEQFELREEGSPRIDIGPELSAWHFSRTQNERSVSIPALEEEIDGPADVTSDAGITSHIEHLRMELKALNHGQAFPYALAEMSFRLGVIRGRLAEKCNDTVPAEQIVIRANSIFLMDCVRVIKSGDRWDEILQSKFE
jgi:hypothetical protein